MISLLIGIILLIGLMLIGVPVAMSFGAMAIFLASAFDISSRMLVPTAFYQIKSVVLLTIPFFILVGGLMSTGGLAERLIDFVNSFAGRVKGGLGAVAVIACAMFGSIGGSCSSAVAAIGTIMIPKMEEQGFTRGYSTALVACSSILGQLIPPSVPMILYALVTYQSIPGCWLATIGPGLLIMLTYCIFNFIMVRNMPIKVSEALPFKAQMKEVGRSTRKASFTLLLPILILGTIYGGIATPTEAACVAVFYVILVSMFIYKSLGIQGLKEAFVGGATTTGVLVIMFFFVMINTRIMTMEQLPQELASWLMSLSSNPLTILLMVNVFLLFIGMIMDDISGTVIAASLLFPVMEKIGVHPLHFAAILGVNLGLGNVSPPTAPILYLAGRIGNAKIETYLKPAMILMYGGMFPIALITTYWPDLSLFLPRLFGYAG
ncbi:MAG: TRAP transporter large permease [Desulfuromusa sp.]|nr:TRAP transporter large permease [Desulfuromusa sp.]